MMRKRLGQYVNRWTLWAGLMVLPFAAVGRAPAAQVQQEAHHYVEHVGDLHQKVHWCAIKAPVNRLIYRSAAEVNVTEADATLATVRWQMHTNDRQTAATAVRQGNELLINGILDGALIVRSAIFSPPTATHLHALQ
jgi:hypothetical protein